MSNQRPVTEQDLRRPEFANVKDLSELEFDADGNIVRKDRWEMGIRNIVAHLGLRQFTIDQVVAQVGVLAEGKTVTKSDARKIFLDKGFTIKLGEPDLKPYVFAAIEELLLWAGVKFDKEEEFY